MGSGAINTQKNLENKKNLKIKIFLNSSIGGGGWDPSRFCVLVGLLVFGGLFFFLADGGGRNDKLRDCGKKETGGGLVPEGVSRLGWCSGARLEERRGPATRYGISRGTADVPGGVGGAPVGPHKRKGP